jgi:FkbH-like protein
VAPERIGLPKPLLGKAARFDEGGMPYASEQFNSFNSPKERVRMAISLKPGGAAVAIAATFTAEPLLPALQFVLREAGLALNVRFAPYNQAFQELLSPTSLLATNTGGVDVVLVRMEDFVREVEDTSEALAIVARTAKELADALVHHSRRVKVPMVFAVMPPSARTDKALLPGIDAANAALADHARALPGITLLTSEDLDLVSSGERYDSEGDQLAHMPFTEDHYASIALAIARKVHALRVPAHEVLVLDCDETFWRGVIGEDGADGVTISPGLARIQQFAVKVQTQGTLVCLVSKNTERDVLEVFEKRPDMTLRLEQIVAHRINWEPKSRNIVSLAQALNLGLDSFVFLDDNPVECALMRAELPEVVTLQVPPDDEIESFLSHLWTFDKVAVTDEDARRTSMYREDAARQKLKESTTDIAKFMASLGVEIDIAAPEESEWARSAQLTQRTNQFNFTTVRRTDPELRALSSGSSTVLRVKVLDRFGDYGLVGLIILDESSGVLGVDTLLLSCRVLGRGVEHTILRRLGERAKQRGLPQIELRLVPTSNNEPARAFAESVAAEFRLERDNSIIYRIPAERACAIVHHPGHEPVAIIEHRESEENNSFAPGVSASSTNRSKRYAELAQTLVSGSSVLRAARNRGARSRSLQKPLTAPTTDMERRLLALWQELLGIKGLGVEDDYFELGGTSLITARLMAEISRRFGVKLPLTTILHSPTVRALARYLDQQGDPRSSTLVELRRGGPRKLFLVHDGDGETLLYVNLARRMPEDLAVFGIEPRRIAGVPLAHTSIEDMAACYIEEVRKIQPRGPYLFGGMCAGGVIAFEMASQLTRSGESVDLVVLLDAARPKARKKHRRITKIRINRINQAIADVHKSQLAPLERAGAVVSTISQKLAGALRWEILQRAEQWSVRFRFRLLRELLVRKLGWPRFVPELSTRQIYDSAEALYVPKPLPLPSVVLARAQTGEADDIPYRYIYADETFGWDTVARGLAIVDVDGGHSTMLQEHYVDSLAEALMPYLQHNVGSIRERPSR